MSSFFQSLSAAFASFNSSPRRPRSDDPQRPLDQHRRNSISSPRRRDPPASTAGACRRIRRTKNEFSLGADEDDKRYLDLSFDSPHDIAAPQVCPSLSKLLIHLCLPRFDLFSISRYCFDNLGRDIYLTPWRIGSPPAVYLNIFLLSSSSDAKLILLARPPRVMPTNLHSRLDLYPHVDNCGLYPRSPS